MFYLSSAVSAQSEAGIHFTDTFFVMTMSLIFTVVLESIVVLQTDVLEHDSHFT